VGELLARIDSRELAEWVAYERVAGPVGPERADVLSAIVASTVANAMRGKRGKAFKLSDFTVRWDDPARWQQAEQSGQDHLRLAQSITRMMSGRGTARREHAS